MTDAAKCPGYLRSGERCRGKLPCDEKHGSPPQRRLMEEDRPQELPQNEPDSRAGSIPFAAGQRAADERPKEPADTPQPSAVERRDVRAVAWETLDRVLREPISAPYANAASSLIRALITLGDDPQSEDEDLAFIEMRGLLMNGFQPRNDEEWERARKHFGEASIEEFKRWDRLSPRALPD